MDDRRMLELVVAGNYAEAQKFARLKGWASSGWRYVDRPEQLYGCPRWANLHLVGSWPDKPHHAWLMRIARERELVVIENAAAIGEQMEGK